MADKKFTVKPGGRVIIEINREPEQKKKFVGHLSLKGLIGTRRENEYLPRRLKKTGAINIYDFAYIRADAESPFITPELFAPYDLSIVYETSQIIVAQNAANFNEMISALYNAVFSILESDRKTRCYKIEKGDAVFEQTLAVQTGGIDTYLDDLPDDKWTPDGLKLTADERSSLVLVGSALLYNANYTDFATAEVFDAETDVLVEDFLLAENADIFLMASPVYTEISTFYKSGTNGDGEQLARHELGNASAIIFPREHLADYLELLAALDAEFNFNHFYWDLALLIKEEMPGARGARYTWNVDEDDGAESLVAISINDIPNPSYFSRDGYLTVSPTAYGEQFSAGFGSVFGYSGLKMLIHQNGAWYYV